jgi:hypothetical protein
VAIRRGLIALGVLATLLGPADLAVAAGPPGGLQVDVVNTPANPVPVTGNIGLATGSSITIDNPASDPVPVQDVREPFQASSPDQTTLPFPAVPAGKRLVIEHVSVELNISAAGVAVSTCGLNRTDGGPPDFFTVQPTASNAFNHFFVGSVQTKYYVETGKAPKFFVVR